MKYFWLLTLAGAAFSIIPCFSAYEKYKLYKISKHIDNSTNLNEWNKNATPEERFVREQLASAATRWFNIIEIFLVSSVIIFFVGQK